MILTDNDWNEKPDKHSPAAQKQNLLNRDFIFINRQCSEHSQIHKPNPKGSAHVPCSTRTIESIRCVVAKPLPKSSHGKLTSQS